MHAFFGPIFYLDLAVLQIAHVPLSVYVIFEFNCFSISLVKSSPLCPLIVFFCLYVSLWIIWSELFASPAAPRISVFLWNYLQYNAPFINGINISETKPLLSSQIILSLLFKFHPFWRTLD